MATEVFTTQDVTLLDGTELELRPLPIAKLRKFSRLWADHMKWMQTQFKAHNDSEESELDEAGMSDEQLTVFIKMCALGLEADLKGEKNDKQFKDHLENVLDEQTIYTILRVCGGLDLNNSGNQNPATAPGEGGTN